jgi:hypothetical protein
VIILCTVIECKRLVAFFVGVAEAIIVVSWIDVFAVLLSISPTYYEQLLSYQSVFCSFSLITVWLCKNFGKRKSAQKLLIKYVGEIDNLSLSNEEKVMILGVLQQHCLSSSSLTMLYYANTYKSMKKCDD